MSDPPEALRVVHVCCTDAFAGVERHVSELAAAQAAAGDRVVVVGGDGDRVREAVGSDVGTLPGHRIDVAVLSLTRLPFRPDVVNVHMTAAEVALGLALPLVEALRSARVVSTRHFASPRGNRRLTRPVARLASRRIDGQIAVSQYVADHVDGPSTVVLSGVRPEGDRVPAAGRERVVLLAQRLEREKRTDLALRAFAMSGLVEQGWRLAVAGSGSLGADLERLSQALGIAAATDFLGHRRDVHDLMRSSAVLLASRPDEAFGLSVVEAMARGLPVVASASGAHLETVGSVDGAALFRSGDSHDAGLVLRALALDVQQREAYGERLQDVQREHFTTKLQARRTDGAFRDLL